MSEGLRRHIRKMIEEECSRGDNLAENCAWYGFSVADFYAYLDAADRANAGTDFYDTNEAKECGGQVD